MFLSISLTDSLQVSAEMVELLEKKNKQHMSLILFDMIIL